MLQRLKIILWIIGIFFLLDGLGAFGYIDTGSVFIVFGIIILIFAFILGGKKKAK